ncbi:MAG: hypothetical protein WCF88_13975 [Candidatus Acidiferrales bacterium]|jgi:hypothetical protein
MAVRKCPNCGAVMPAGSVAVYSYDLVCASCQHPLAVSEISRNLAAFAGLAAGAIAWWIATLRFATQPGALGWVWPVVLGYLTASVVAAVALMFVANLVLSDGDPTPQSAAVTSPVHH